MESAYITQEQSSRLLVMAGRWLPVFLSLQDDEYWLVERSARKRVNVDNVMLAALGIWGVKVRGTGYEDRLAHAANLRLGSEVTLRREPNEFDPDAIAIDGRDGMLGYFNKGMAHRLSKLLDTGAAIEANVVALSPLKVIAGDPDRLRALFDNKKLKRNSVLR